MFIRLLINAFVLLVLVSATYLHAEESAKLVGDPYYLATDPVSDQPLGDKPKVVIYEGRQLRFSGDETYERFNKDPKSILAKLDKALIEDQLKNYPLQECPVSGEKLGGMGEPINGIYHNRLLRFCCDSCPKRAEKKFDSIKTKLDQAVIDAQLSKYPLKECVVTGKALDQNAVNYVVGSRLVRLADADALKEFNTNPAKYLAKLSASH